MSSLPTRRQRLLSMTVTVVVIAVAGFIVESFRDDPESATAESVTSSTPEADDEVIAVEELAGDVLVVGSSSGSPIVKAQAERFAAAAPGIAVTFELGGADDGAARFCAGDAPVANLPRLLTESEYAACEAAGVEFAELRRAVDAVTLLTSPANDAVSCVSFNDLYALLSVDAEGFTSWADANALTGGWGGTTFPDAPLTVLGPEPEGSTHESLRSIVLETVASGGTGLDAAALGLVDAVRTDYEAQTEEADILAGLAAGETSFGFVESGFAFEAVEAGDARSIQVSFEDGGTCITPNEETIAAAAYPVSRYVYTYVNAAAAEADPAVSAFVDFMIADENADAVEEVGYVPLTTPDRLRARTIWNSGLLGAGQWGE